MADPYDMAGVGSVAAQQPDFIAKLLAQLGIAPPTMTNGPPPPELGASLMGGGGQVGNLGMGGEGGPAAAPAAPIPDFGPLPASPTTTPQQAPAAGGGAGLAALLAGAGRTGFQSADTRPQFSGGVTQAQRVPEGHQMQAGQQSAIGAAQARLFQPQLPINVVPTLGALLRGGGR